MQQPPVPSGNDSTENKQDALPEQSDLHAEKDGRNKEWEDRARVNLETNSPDTQTNLERDFEPEREDLQPPDHPSY